VTGKLKVIILVLVVLLAISFFIIFGIQNSRLKLVREYRETKQTLTQRNEELSRRLERALAENQTHQDRLGILQEDLERISSERDHLQQKFELVNKEREELLQRVGSYGQLQENLDSFQDTNQKLQEQIATLEQAKLTLEARLNEATQDKENFEQRIAQAKQILKKEPAMAGYVYVQAQAQERPLTQQGSEWSVDLPPIVVSPPPQVDTGVKASFSLTGKILNVNTKYAFVVIDLGQQMGVRNGMVFDVFRRNTLLGRVEVIQLREKIAACNIVQADMLFKTGDTVRY